MSSMSTNIQAIRPKLYQLHILCLAAAAFFLPLKIHYCNIATGVSFGLWLISCTPETFKQTRTTYIFYAVVLSLYIIQIIGLPYSDNISRGFFMLETKLGLVLFPTMILLSSLDAANIRRIFTAFIVGVLLACLWCHVNAIQNALVHDSTMRDFFLSDRFQNDKFTAPIKMHPAYLGWCISIIIFHIIDERLRTARSRFPWYVILAYFSLCLFVLMSRAALTAFGAALLVYVWLKLVYLQKRYMKAGLVTGAFILTFILFLTFVPNFKSRMSEVINNFHGRFDTMDYNSTTLHVRQWYCAWNSVSGAEFIWGLGTGDELDALMECYVENEFNHLVEQKLDAHNEYLSSIVRHGLLGLVVFVGVLGFTFTGAFLEKNVQYLVFIVMVSIHALSVSILYGQASLVIYALFNSLFIKAMLIKQFKESGSQSGLAN